MACPTAPGTQAGWGYGLPHCSEGTGWGRVWPAPHDSTARRCSAPGAHRGGRGDCVPRMSHPSWPIRPPPPHSSTSPRPVAGRPDRGGVHEDGHGGEAPPLGVSKQPVESGAAIWGPLELPFRSSCAHLAQPRGARAARRWHGEARYRSPHMNSRNVSTSFFDPSTSGVLWCSSVGSMSRIRRVPSIAPPPAASNRNANGLAS